VINARFEGLRRGVEDSDEEAGLQAEIL